MGRRKGELSPGQVDREYPHQIALHEDLCTGSPQYETVREFARRLTVSHRGHTFFRDDAWHNVFCFREKADAEAFHARFGGEWFDPSTRGRGPRWQLLRNAKKRYY
jgi:hypothetical protein